MYVYLKLHSGGRRFYLRFPSETDARKVFDLMVLMNPTNLKRWNSVTQTSLRKRFLRRSDKRPRGNPGFFNSGNVKNFTAIKK